MKRCQRFPYVYRKTPNFIAILVSLALIKRQTIENKPTLLFICRKTQLNTAWATRKLEIILAVEVQWWKGEFIILFTFISFLFQQLVLILKTKSEMKLNLHVLFLGKKKEKSEVQQRMDNHLVANRFHEITNEIQTLQVFSLYHTKEFLRNLLIGFCGKFVIKLIIASFITIRFHSYVRDYHPSILANFEIRLAQ